jgi:hypothetical protein
MLLIKREHLLLWSQKRESGSNEQKEQAKKTHCEEDQKAKEVINNLKKIDKQQQHAKFPPLLGSGDQLKS